MKPTSTTTTRNPSHSIAGSAVRSESPNWLSHFSSKPRYNSIMTEILYKRENFLAPSPLMIPPVELVQLKMRQCNAAASDAPLHMPLGAIDPSSESQAHGRKMLRRVANRRSAQQSRARKKVRFPTKRTLGNFLKYFRILTRIYLLHPGSDGRP